MIMTKWLIIICIIFVGGIVVQLWLSKRKKYILGLILPICFCALNIITYFVNGRGENNMLPTWAYCAGLLIYPIILLIIFFAVKKRNTLYSV